MSTIEATRRYFDAWNARDTLRLSASFRPAGTYEDPNTGGPIDAGAPLAAYAGALFNAFPDLRFEETGIREIGAGELLVPWIMHGTNRGSLRGLPPTNATIALPGVDIVTAAGDGVDRVRGYFDRQTLMEQLGVQVVVQPRGVGPLEFGVCTQVHSGSQAPPAALSLTMIEARTDQEVQRIRDVSRRIMLQLAGMPGFLSFQGAVVGRRLTTVTLWDSRQAARQIMGEANHKEASGDMFAGRLACAFHHSAWSLDRMGELWVRCACGSLRDARAQPDCECGTAVARPAYW